MPIPDPVWKYLGNLGDASPIEYGGFFIYEDATGFHDPQGIYIVPMESSEGGEEAKVQRYTIKLERLRDAHFPFSLAMKEHPLDWFPDERYGGMHVTGEILRNAVWFDRDLPKIAEISDVPLEELIESLKSEDVLKRAYAYLDLIYYYGPDEFHSYYTTLTEAEVKKLYPEPFRRRRR